MKNPISSRTVTFLGSLGLAGLLLTTISVLARADTPSASGGSRVAVIDVQKVLSQSNAGKGAYDKLKKLQEDKVAKAKLMDDELRKLDNDLSTKRSTLSAAKIAELEKQIADKRIAMQRYAQDADKEIASARDKELAALEAKIKPVIDAYGKEVGLTAIFNKFESGLIYASDGSDITDLVVQRFNKAVPKP